MKMTVLITGASSGFGLMLATGLHAPHLSFYSASKHAVQGYFKSLRFELCLLYTSPSPRD